MTHLVRPAAHRRVASSSSPLIPGIPRTAPASSRNCSSPSRSRTSRSKSARPRGHRVRPPAGTRAPDTVVFVDGVRRLEARAWIDTAKDDAVPGIFASYAAGAIRCSGTATLEDVQVGRGLFAPAPDLDDVVDPPRHVRRVQDQGRRAGVHQLRGARTHDGMRSAHRRSRAPRRRRAHRARRTAAQGSARPRRDRLREDASRALPARAPQPGGRRARGGRTDTDVPHRRPSVQPHDLVRPAPGAGRWTVGGHRALRGEWHPAPRDPRRARGHCDCRAPRFASVAHKDPRAPRTWHRSARSSVCCGTASGTPRSAIARSVPRVARA